MNFCSRFKEIPRATLFLSTVDKQNTLYPLLLPCHSTSTSKTYNIELPVDVVVRLADWCQSINNYGVGNVAVNGMVAMCWRTTLFLGFPRFVVSPSVLVRNQAGMFFTEENFSMETSKITEQSSEKRTGQIIIIISFHSNAYFPYSQTHKRSHTEAN